MIMIISYIFYISYIFSPSLGFSPGAPPDAPGSHRHSDAGCPGPKTYRCVLRREWMGCWGLLELFLIVSSCGSFPKIPYV